MKQIIVSGFGGQGVISLGLMISYAAMKEDRNTSFLPSYGPEMRGGTANCSVVVSEKEVASPVISRPDLLVALNVPSVAKFLPNLAEGGRAFIDADMPVDAGKGRSDVIAVPLKQLAQANLKGQNIAMLGAILSFTELQAASAEAAIRDVFKHKPQFIDSNLACLHAGMEWAEKNVR